MKEKNILEVTDFSQKEWEQLIKETNEFKKNLIEKNPYSKTNASDLSLIATPFAHGYRLKRQFISWEGRVISLTSKV